MAKAREKSDGRVVPEGRRKPSSTAHEERGGKASTVSETAVQLELSFETADRPKSESTESFPPPPDTMEKIASATNLLQAWTRVESNEGAAGPDGESIAQVRKHLDEVIAELHRKLLDGSYRVGMIRRVWIPKPDGGERGLGIPDVIDRIVQQAVAQILSPLYEPEFHPSSHGFRPGRSCHTAIAEASVYLADGYEWVVDIDLSRFFDRVHHERLLARLAQRIDDARVLRLIRLMLRAKVVMPDGVVVNSAEGTPQSAS